MFEEYADILTAEEACEALTKMLLMEIYSQNNQLAIGFFI